MSDANLPVFALRRGPWLAEVFDPRPGPAILGGRFVHAGWIHRLVRDGAPISGRTNPYFTAASGHGFPETFESGLGWHLCKEGEEYLRPGCGRLVRHGDDPTETNAHGRLSVILPWEVESGPDWVAFRTSDAIGHHRAQLGYRLERSIRLTDDGLVSSTVFTLIAPMYGMVPVSWYAHPFFHQARSDATGFRLPAGARMLPNPRVWRAQLMNPEAVEREPGVWRLPESNTRSAFAGLWGSRAPTEVLLSPEAGGGVMEVALDAPLDHIVLWGNDLTASVEPKIARTMLHGERAEWSVAYRWRP